ncbi:pilus assembly protein TadG-related protein [Antarcticirhabdus aurantiaca]|uniref:Pilus assembly protein n=1 Tax=Antarcticirhabdus aurantiaca TaxID=2606717 RepID=A0ACD4NJ65_9HYPH|nr:pilus assembly protein [Jeongeuplla avenae]
MRRFLADNRGNFAVIAAMILTGLLVSLGGAVDMARAYAGRAKLQHAVDAAALSIASSDETDPAKLADLATTFIMANISAHAIKDVVVSRATIDEDNRVVVEASGNVDMTFLSMINYPTLGFDLVAETDRPNEVELEVALVLDNTFSMNDADDKGTRKIDALKTAAKLLVSMLMTEDDKLVSIGLVPYANNVNVGKGFSGATWLTDTKNDVQTSTKTCRDITEESYCATRAPSYQCAKNYDGVIVMETCSGACLETKKRYFDPPKVSCSGGGTTTYKFEGCVGSRRTGTTHLHDGSPSELYPAFRTTGQTSDHTRSCLKPIVSLSKKRAPLEKAIDDLIINIGTYRPQTYIPSGLIWGQNLLSPSEPFQARDYPEAGDKTLRKIMILMTDGENTLRLASGRDGTHTAPSGNAGQISTQLTKTNQDTAALCTYSKSKGIEIFTIALMVDDSAAKSLLETCATNKAHYFDASDADGLVNAFRSIAGSINAVRIVK